jgi:hypothetical protein
MGGKSQQSSSQVTIPPEVLARYNSVNATAETAAQTPFQSYGGQFVAPLTGSQQAGIENTNAAAGQAQPSIQAGQLLSLASAQNLNPTEYSGDQINKYFNPYVGAVYDATAANIQRQNEVQQQGMLGDQIKANAFGGDRGGIQRAELMRSQNLAGQQTLSDILQKGFAGAQTEFNTQQQIGLGAAQNTAGRMAQAGQSIGALGVQGQTAALAGANAQMQAGQVEQGTQQADLTAQYNQFLQQKSYPFQVAQFLANIAEGTGALSGSTTTSTSPAPFFSDARMKENMAPIGETFDGQPIYRYNYKGDDRTQIGLVAQDVARSHPDAVGQDSGYLTVDYDKATRNAAEEGLGAARHRAGGGMIDPYAQKGGGQSAYPTPNSYVPQPILPVGQLITAKVPESKSSSGLADAAKNASSISSMVKDGKGFFDWGSDKVKNFGYSGIGGLAAAGGRIGYDDGGYVDDNQDNQDKPDDLEAPMAGRPPDVHSFVPKADLPIGTLKPTEAPKMDGKSPFGEILDVAKFGAKLAMGMPFARGGAAAYADMDPDEMAIRTLDREARNQPDDGVAAVGHVFLNRERAGGYGDGLSGVILKPKQFSPWNTAGTGSREDPMTVDMQSPSAQRMAAIWQRVRSGEIPDPTNGATHFYAPKVVNPSWARGKDVQPIGDHNFLQADAGRGASNAIARAAPSEGLGNARAYAPDSSDDGRPVTLRGTRIAQAQAQPPGLAGATRNDAEEPGFGSLAKKIGIDGNTGMALASGLFGMLASRSPWLGNAIGEGGLSAVQTYKDMQAQDANVENTRAQATNTRMDAFGKSFKDINGQMFVFDKNGNAILLQNYKENPTPLAGSRSSTDLVNAGGPSAKPGGQPPLTVPKLAPVESSPLAPPLPAAGEAARANQSPMLPPPPPANNQPASTGSTVPSRLSRETISAADQEGRSFASATGTNVLYAEHMQRAKDMTDRAQAEREAAERTGPIVNELAKTIANTPKTGWMQSGAWADARAKIGRELNQVLAQGGFSPFTDPANITNADIQEKLKQIQAGTNAQNAQQGHVAAYMIDQYKATVPNSSMTPEAQAELMAQNYVTQQRTIDRAQALAHYRARSGAGNNNMPGTAIGFEDGFSRDANRTEYLKDQKAIQDAYMDRDVNGKHVNWMQLVLSGRVTKPEEIDKLLGRPGIHRYFTGAASKLQGQ